MPSDVKKRAYRTDMLLAAAMVVVGVAISGVSLTELSARDTRFAQATPPLQSTPGAEAKPSAPSEPVTTGQRPREIPPQPAQPDAQAQKAGVTPALPQAPAEKIAAPIQEK
jgi:type IV secretory pathway VirB10-like protein